MQIFHHSREHKDLPSGHTLSLLTFNFPQVQDDYLDAYGDPAVIGKVGTDIEDNKCSWMICTVLQHASEEQKEVVKVWGACIGGAE